MSLFDWKKRLGMEAQSRSANFVMPTLALDVEPLFVAGARLDASSRQIQRMGVRQLAAGVLDPSPNKPNVTDAKAIREAVVEVAALLGNSGGKIGLLIPDVAARVAVLQFDGLPDNQREAESLIHWRMREFLPFAPEEARFSYQVMVKEPGRVEILETAIRGSVLAEYEAALEGISGGAALVLPASVALLPLLPDESSGQLLLHLCPGSLTVVVMGLGRVRYWRTRPLEGEVGPDSREEVAREAARVLATCQDHLNLQVQDIWFCSRPPAAPEMQEAVSKTLGRELRLLPGNRASATRLPPGEHSAFDDFGMPFAGLVANRGDAR
jgi:hypothetical protein